MDSLHAPPPPPPPPSLPKNKKSPLHLRNILTIPTASTPFWLQLSYILALSFIGFLLLQSLPMKHPSTPPPSHLEFFFTSISANTVSSMAVVEMESFSNSQLLLLTILMLLGGEVFTSMLPLLLLNHNHKPKSTQLELIVVESSKNSTITKHPTTPINSHLGSGSGSNKLKKYLGYVVLGYFVALHASGWAFIMAYQSLFPATLALVESRGIKPNIFAIFTVVSSFTNCGFIPTNENMIVFRSCSGILLAICVLVLLGNTLYPVALRCVVWVLKVVTKRREFDLILKNEEEEDVLDEYVMRNGAEAAMLGATVGGFVVVQVVLFAVTEWGSKGLKGMTVYEKMVGSVFMSVNSRHAGETVVDLSLLSPAILVLFVVMMYLPPYILPWRTRVANSWENIDKYSVEGNLKRKKRKTRSAFVEYFMFSQLSYLAIFIIIICITERRHFYEDPLNFNVFNIVIEVISAYGNVGFTTGYSCKRQLNPNKECKDSWVGFSGKWSNKGKLTLIVVMIFGRLKKYNMEGGKAWLIR